MEGSSALRCRAFRAIPTSIVFTLVLAVISQLGGSNATLIRQNIPNAAVKRAVCLDGSDAGYYLYRNTSSSNWIIHLQGGGFCTTNETCVARASSSQGSSNAWTCALPSQTARNSEDAAATVSSNSRRNPNFRYWNRVFVPYCSGDLWLGQSCRASSLYNVRFCGHFIITAVIDDLLTRQGMRNATEVVFGGSSAGAIGTQMHLEDVAASIRTATLAATGTAAHVAGYMDGWTRLYPTLTEISSNPSVTPETAPSVAQLILLARLAFVAYIPPSCSNMYSTTAAPFHGLQCVDARWGMQTITSVPVMLLAARWDTYAIFLSIGMARYACASTNGSVDAAESNFIQNFGTYSYNHVLNISRAAAAPGGEEHSIFFSSCYTHTFIAVEDVCSGVNDKTAYESLVSFLSRSKANMRETLISNPPLTSQPLRCNADCGATQCSWGLRPVLSARGSCGTIPDSSWDGFRHGDLCPGVMPPDLAVSDTFNQEMVLYKVVNATQRSAICLDESPAAYLVARNSASKNWIILLRGGGFCNSGPDCNARKFTIDGSSNNYACTLPAREKAGTYIESLSPPINPDPSLNPDYHDWNRVFVRYCSGDTYLGRKTRASGNLFQVSTAGHFCLVATFEDLLSIHGMNGAQKVVIGGQSAGSIAVTAHLDLLAGMIKTAAGPSTQVAGFGDGGWFRAYPDENDIARGHSWDNWATSMFSRNIALLFGTIFNAYQDPDCQRARIAESNLGGQECLDAKYSVPYVSTSFIMLASRWDTYDLFIKFGSRRYVCAVGSGALTAEEQNYTAEYGIRSYRELSNFTSNTSAVFAPTCFTHVNLGIAQQVPGGPVLGGPACNSENGKTPYQALSEFVDSAFRGVADLGTLSVIGTPPTDALRLRCGPGCGAPQCSWATMLTGNPWNATSATSGICPEYPGTSFGAFNASAGLVTCNTNIQSGIPTTTPPTTSGTSRLAYSWQPLLLSSLVVSIKLVLF